MLNEETLKNTIILPLLLDIGISPGEMEFESNFNIQLGRGVYNIKNDEQSSATGRLDILCKRNGYPLFVIELKAEDEVLTDTDRLQGLSYARLMEPMAPFVLLTNGNSTHFLILTAEEK